MIPGRSDPSWRQFAVWAEPVSRITGNGAVFQSVERNAAVWLMSGSAPALLWGRYALPPWHSDAVGRVGVRRSSPGRDVRSGRCRVDSRETLLSIDVRGVQATPPASPRRSRARAVRSR